MHQFSLEIVLDNVSVRFSLSLGGATSIVIAKNVAIDIAMPKDRVPADRPTAMAAKVKNASAWDLSLVLYLTPANMPVNAKASGRLNLTI